MSTTQKIVVIGGVAAGPKAAARAGRRDPHAEITLVERGQWISYAGCGMPYYIEGLMDSPEELIRTPVGVPRNEAFFKSVKGVTVRTSTAAERIDRQAKQVHVRHVQTGRTDVLAYDKLVLATGASPIVPPIEGTDLTNVFRLSRPDEAIAIREAAVHGKAKRAVVIGGGLIGMETAEALAALGVQVTMLEMMAHVLPTQLDFETAAFLTKHLASQGVEVRVSEPASKLLGEDGRVRQVVTPQATLEADMVLLAIGVRPNVELARQAGIEIGPTGAIAVNEYLQTSDPDIYAGGDCAECTHRITGQKVFVPLGSTANRHGRVIGDNVTGGQSTFEGILGTMIFKAFEFTVARTGLSEQQARELGYDVVTSLAAGPDHAHYYPDAKPILIKLIAEAKTGRLLGGQVVGAGQVAKRIDVLASVLHFRGTVDDLAGVDLSYAPPYSEPIDNIAQAANIIRNKRAGLAKALSPQQVKAKLEAGEDFVLLDVRTPAEIEQMRLDDPRVRYIGLGKLRERIEELPRDKPIVTYCKVSLRGYEAQRILEGAGFKNVAFMDGGLTAWPYELATGS